MSMSTPPSSSASALIVALLGLWTTARTGVVVLGQPCSPNLCSGHGSCESSADGSTSARQCSCNAGWTGADCSLMTCPLGAAWSDKARGTDDAHAPAECSNRGACDRASGVCACDPGFEGQACGRRVCPSNCENHGRCQSMAYFSSVQDPGEGTVYAYESPWDAGMMYGCNCDAGYSGPSCSLRECAVGDDPLTGTDEVSKQKECDKQVVRIKSLRISDAVIFIQQQYEYYNNSRVLIDVSTNLRVRVRTHTCGTEYELRLLYEHRLRFEYRTS